MSNKNVPQPDTPSHKRIDRYLALIALAAIIIAWVAGSLKKGEELMPFFKQTLPQAKYLDKISEHYYAAWLDKDNKNLMAYLSLGSAQGYGGVLKLIVAVSPSGNVLACTLVSHKETYSFIQRVLSKDILKSLSGKLHTDSFSIGEDVDSISGATYTARAIADATRRGTRNIAKDVLKIATPAEPPLVIQFGFTEIILILLFVAAYIGSKSWFKYKKSVRWLTMLTGLVVLGFLYSKPLSLIIINKMLLGYWPQWQLHLYWYILFAATFLFLVMEGKNLYCERICPFGTAQECVAVIGGAKVKVSPEVKNVTRWFQRAFALVVILAALLFSNPSFYTFEVFGVFFRLIGSTFLFGLLGLVLVTGLFIKRPWCNFLCPIRPVMDFIHMSRSWARETLKRKT